MPRTTATTAAALVVLVLGAGGAAAVPPPAEDRPTPQARAAGIDRPGRASMGWTMKDHSSPTTTAAVAARAGGVLGIDVSSHQGTVNWPEWYADGKRFAYVKATESTSYTNPYFAQQYNGSYSAGMIRGAYHFAVPSSSGGATQADYFLRHGGGWSADGKTLPGAVDLEWNPYGPSCYGMSRSQLRSWINAFVDRYKAGTGRYPVIYTNASWWNQCVGSTSSFASRVPLWVARYGSDPGTMPGDWGYETFWQYSDDPIDQNRFNGSYERLRIFATG